VKTPNLAVIYARVSSKEQAEGFSVAAQLDLLNGYAKKHGYKVERVFTEAETAKQAGRKAFRQMLAFLKEHPEVKAVLVEKTDRVYRNLPDYVTLNPDVTGLEIHLVKEGEVLSKESKSHQKFMHGIKVLMAKNYCDNLSEEVVKGLDQKAKEGKWPTYAPFGYQNDLGQHTISPHPEEAPAVVKLFELAATGNHNLNALRKAVYDFGVRSRRTKRVLVKEEVRRILANPIYSGPFIWKGVTHQGTHTPLITRDLFERANVAMRLKSRPKKNKHNFAFTGMVKCRHCGASLTAEVKKGKYTYYRCAKQCENVVYLPENKLSLQLGDALRRIKLTPEIVEWTREALLSSHADQAEHHQAEVARHRARLDKLTSYVDQAYTDRLEGRITPELWERRSAEWETERADIERKLAALGNAKTSYIASGVKLLELAQRAHELYVSQSPHEQRRLLNVVVSNCTLNNGTVEYSLRKPFDLLADISESQNKRRGWDSNPRDPFRSTRFPGVRLQPLGHLSSVTDRVGFEPTIPLPVCLISSQVPSTTRPSVQLFSFSTSYVMPACHAAFERRPGVVLGIHWPIFLQ
jgi:site-specific DNA recombinase